MTSARLCLLVLALGAAGSRVARAQPHRAVVFNRVPADRLSSPVFARGSNPRIAAQIVGSALGAVVLGIAAWTALDNPEGSDRRVKGDEGYTPNANTAFAVGSFVGSAAAAYVIGRGDGSRGSLVTTALGAAIATIPIALGRHQPYLPLIGIVLGAPLQAIGATLGYQLTRRAP
jgi:hypothetical protein